MDHTSEQKTGNGSMRMQLPSPSTLTDLHNGHYARRRRIGLCCHARGGANQEIAKQLGLTLKTVCNHVSNIFSKLQVANRARAAGLGYGKNEG